jgi:PAS domain S-box-containing protein
MNQTSLRIDISERELAALQVYCQQSGQDVKAFLEDCIRRRLQAVACPATESLSETAQQELARLRQEVAVLKTDRSILRDQLSAAQTLVAAALSLRDPEVVLSPDRPAIPSDADRPTEPCSATLSDIGFWHADCQGQWVEVSPPVSVMTQLSPAQLLGDGWTRALHPADRERGLSSWQAFVKQCRSGRSTGQPDYTCLCRLGQNQGAVADTNPGGGSLILLQATPRRSATGEVTDFTGILWDRTQQFNQATTLVHTQKRYHAILSALPDLILRVNREGYCLDVLYPPAPAAGSFYPLRIQDHLSAVLSPPLLQRQLQAIEQALTTGQVQVYEHRLETTDRFAYEEVRVAPAGNGEVVLVVRDISQPRQAELEIDNFFERSSTMFCVADFNGYFRRVNPAWERILGHSQIELLTTPYLDFVHPEDRARTIAEASHISEGMHTLEFENRYRCWDGSYRWLLWNAIPILETGLIYCVVHDITERKQVAENLRRSQQELKLITDSIPGGIAYVDASRRYCFVNQIYESWLNCSREKILGRYLWEVLGTTAYERVQSSIDQVLAGVSVELETAMPLKTGVNRSIHARLVPDFDDSGSVRGYYALVTDISQRKQAEETLRLALENYHSIFDNALTGIYQSTPDGRYLRVNPAMARIHGYDSSRQMLQTIENIGSQVYCQAEVRQQFQQLMQQQGQVQGFQYQVYRRDGRLIWLEEKARAVKDKDGHLLYYEGFVEDITERKQAEESLRKQLQTLQIQIDQKQRQREVEQVMGTDYFQDIQAHVDQLRVEE